MSATFDELGRQYPGSAGIGFRYLAAGTSPSNTAAEVAHNTRLVELAFQNLINWGHAGVRGTLDAYRELVKRLPTDRYRVDIDKPTLGRMERNVDSIEGELGKTIDELERSVRDAERVLRELERDPAARALQQDERLRISGHKRVLDELKKRRYEFRSEAEKLRFRLMIPR